MKYRNVQIALVLLVLAVAGCTTTSKPKLTNLGVINVSSGIPSRHVLADGRTCVMTPTLLPGGSQIKLLTSIDNTNAAGTRHLYSLEAYFSPEKTTIFTFDKSNIISLTLHVPK